MGIIQVWRDKRSDLWAFMRFKICFSGATLAAFSFLLFNDPSSEIIAVIIAAYALMTAIYTYNMITDKREDLINKGKVNKWVVDYSGSVLSMSFLLLGTLLSISVDRLPIYTFAALAGFSYSYFRVKEIFPWKNIYTGLLVGLTFLYGAEAGLPTVLPVFGYLGVSMIFIAASVVSDLRDYEGDKQARIKTVPVHIGKSNSRMLFANILGATSGLMLMTFGIMWIYPALFAIPSIVLAQKERYHLSHSYIVMSFITIPLALFFAQA